MRHIKKRFQNERFFSEEEEKRFRETGVSVDLSKAHTVKLEKGAAAILSTKEGRFFTAFQHIVSGKKFLVPEPDPVLVFFHSAYTAYRGVLISKPSLFENLNVEEMIDERVSNELYRFFSYSFTYATMLFASMEAFINKKIPIGHTYTEVKPKMTVTLNKEQIENDMSFDSKVKNVLNEITKKDFAQ